ncbi:MAG: chain length determinant protein tyrosine kinase EpsG [Burkholderiales bacterium]|nr:chain length determinant protein tyrosine kinase EpsG [Burkholderiales bacterium]
MIPVGGAIAKRSKRAKRPSLIPQFKAGPGATTVPLLGAILVREGKLTAESAERVQQLQHRTQLRFGETAVQFGLVGDADVAHALALQFDYPYLPDDDERIDPEVISAFRPFDARVEAMRALRAQVMLRWLSVGSGGRAIAMIGPGRGDGRSYLAANLAVVFAQLGTRTVLIDADMRHPRQHKLFKLSNQSGLSQILAGRGEPESIQSIPALRSLSVIPAGPLPPNPQELLLRAQFEELLDELEGTFHVIIIDAPAGVDGADVHFIARAARAALMVVRQNHTRVKAATRLQDELAPTGVSVLGTVLNKF